MKLKSYYLKIPLLMLATTLVVSCTNSGAENQRPGQQVQPFPILELQPRSITLATSYPATLEGFQTVELRPRVQGYITGIPVEEGAVVEKGEVLFRLSNKEYEQQIRTA